MGKYWTMYTLGIQNAIAYRGPMIFWILGALIQALIPIALWLTLQPGTLIGSYSKSGIITYYILAFILGRFLAWYPANWIRDEIKSGEIVGTVILKPINLFKRTFAGEAAWHTVSFSFEFFISIAILYVFREYFVFLVTWSNLVPIIFAVTLALFITLTISTCVGLLAFWLTEVEIVDAIFWVLLSIFGGYAVPLTFFPKNLQGLIDLLPFRYMFSFPLEIYFGKVSSTQMFYGFLVGSVWLVVLYLTYRWMWRNGLKVYTAWGN